MESNGVGPFVAPYKDAAQNRRAHSPYNIIQFILNKTNWMLINPDLIPQEN